MNKLLRVLGFFVLTVFILSITVNSKPIFSYIYQVISPATHYAQNLTQDLLKDSFHSAQGLSKKLFENSVPKAKDTLKTKSSAPVRNDEESFDDIVNEDREELDELIKTPKK